MAQKYLTNLDLNKNQLLNAIIQTLAVEPSNAKEGQIIYDSQVKKLKIYNGTEWEEVGSTLTSEDLVNLINSGSVKIDKDKIQGLTEMLDEVSMSGIDIVSAINSPENTSKISLDKLAEVVARASDLENLETKDDALSTKNTLQQNLDNTKQELESRLSHVEMSQSNPVEITMVNGLQDALSNLQAKDDDMLRQAKAYSDEVKTSIVGLASEDADTLKEIEDIIKKNKADIEILGAVANKYVTQVGDDVSTEHTITHNLNTTSVSVTTRSTVAPYEEVITSVTIVDDNSIKISTAQPIGELTKIEVTVVG